MAGLWRRVQGLRSAKIKPLLAALGEVTTADELGSFCRQVRSPDLQQL